MDAHDWDRRYSATGLVWGAEPNRFLVAEAADLAPGRALDLACGEGRNALWLAARGWRVTGVDFSRVAVERAREAATGRGLDARFEVGDVTAGPVPGAPADLVVVMYLQVPASARAAALAGAAGALAPGGTLLVVGHADVNPDEGWGGPGDRAVLYGPEEIAALLEGLVVERAERVPRPVETADGVRTAIDTLVRVHRPRRDDGARAWEGDRE
jgi:SAM-dependent methyltransferase